MSIGTALTKPDSAITPWASRQDLRELRERIKLLPGGDKLTEHEALALAQISLAHGLDPFNGEVWYLKDKNGRSLGIMAGIKGHRRAAHNQLDREGGGNYWVEFDGPLSVDELSALHLPHEALAFRSRIYDSRNIATYTESVSRMMSAGVPWEVVKQMLGERPYTPGIGYAMPGEPSRMSTVQLAQKRAEADGLKRRFDLPFASAVGVNGDSDVIEGEFTSQIGQTPERDPAEIEARMRAGSSALYGNGDGLGPKWESDPVTVQTAPTAKSAQHIKRIWKGETVQLVIKSGGAATGQEAADLLNKSQLSPSDSEDVLIRWIGKYKSALGDGQASEQAICAADETLPQTSQ